MTRIISSRAAIWMGALVLFSAGLFFASAAHAFLSAPASVTAKKEYARGWHSKKMGDTAAAQEHFSNAANAAEQAMQGEKQLSGPYRTAIRANCELGNYQAVLDACKALEAKNAALGVPEPDRIAVFYEGWAYAKLDNLQGMKQAWEGYPVEASPLSRFISTALKTLDDTTGSLPAGMDDKMSAALEKQVIQDALDAASKSGGKEDGGSDAPDSASDASDSDASDSAAAPEAASAPASSSSSSDSAPAASAPSSASAPASSGGGGGSSSGSSAPSSGGGSAPVSGGGDDWG